MRLLLDSHSALWWDRDLSKLSARQRTAIGDRANDVFVSAASAWELSIKRATGKLVLRDSVEDLAARLGFIELPITMKHGEAPAALPMHHKDPFDRMLVAQATAEGMVLVTADSKLAQYGVVIL